MAIRVLATIVIVCMVLTLPVSSLADKGQEKKKGDDTDTLTINITKDGKYLIGDKEYTRDAIKALFKERKTLPEHQDKNDPRLVTYSLEVRSDGAASYEHIQWLLIAAARFGGVVKLNIVAGGKKDKTAESDKKEEEPLASSLPKDKGLKPAPLTDPVPEIRIKLRWNKTIEETTIRIGTDTIGTVSRMVIPKDADNSERKEQSDKDKKVWKQLADKAEKLYKKSVSANDSAKYVPVILDADSKTPWEHVVGAINACKSKGIENIEFTGNPKFKDLR